MNETDVFKIIEERLSNDELVLPTLPDVALEANEKLANSDIEIDDIVRVIKKDPAIAASVVKFANTVLVKGNTKIKSIEQATIRIGLNRLRNVIMTSAIEQIFFAKDITFALQLATAWSDSTNAAVCSGATINYLHGKGIAKKISHDSLFLTALVHNIGVLPILTEADRLGKDIDKRFHERKFINKVMANKGNELTETILKRWEFDSEIITPAIQWRSEDYVTSDISIVDIIRLGMTTTDVIDDKKRSVFIEQAKAKGIIEDSRWSRDLEFKNSLLIYKSLF